VLVLLSLHKKDCAAIYLIQNWFIFEGPDLNISMIQYHKNQPVLRESLRLFQLQHHRHGSLRGSELDVAALALWAKSYFPFQVPLNLSISKQAAVEMAWIQLVDISEKNLICIMLLRVYYFDFFFKTWA